MKYVFKQSCSVSSPKSGLLFDHATIDKMSGNTVAQFIMTYHDFQPIHKTVVEAFVRTIGPLHVGLYYARQKPSHIILPRREKFISFCIKINWLT